MAKGGVGGRRARGALANHERGGAQGPSRKRKLQRGLEDTVVGLQAEVARCRCFPHRLMQSPAHPSGQNFPPPLRLYPIAPGCPRPRSLRSRATPPQHPCALRSGSGRVSVTTPPYKRAEGVGERRTRGGGRGKRSARWMTCKRTGTGTGTRRRQRGAHRLGPHDGRPEGIHHGLRVPRDIREECGVERLAARRGVSAELSNELHELIALRDEGRLRVETRWCRGAEDLCIDLCQRGSTRTRAAQAGSGEVFGAGGVGEGGTEGGASAREDEGVLSADWLGTMRSSAARKRTAGVLHECADLESTALLGDADETLGLVGSNTDHEWAARVLHKRSNISQEEEEEETHIFAGAAGFGSCALRGDADEVLCIVAWNADYAWVGWVLYELLSQKSPRFKAVLVGAAIDCQ
ncbi:hypothetical protein FB451DRAFT_1188294 [Mycena latifolia]|nr:hypothetical protein FB451DRAFT_1188294 [Mycena latifolia]